LKKAEGLAIGLLVLVCFFMLNNLPIWQNGDSFLAVRQIDVIQISSTWLNHTTADGSDEATPETVLFHKNGIEASYPRIVVGGTQDEINQWNHLILTDFNKILEIYSFQPFPGPTPAPVEVVPTLLKVTYEIKSNTIEWLSLFYSADFNSSYSAHPSNLIYTTNLDKRHNQRLELNDIVKLSDAFVKEFRTWERKASTDDNKEMETAAQEYINNITDQELLEGLKSADQIGSDNPWGIYSYLTKDGLGISIEVPNYAGDHVEFEAPFTKLTNFLQPRFR